MESLLCAAKAADFTGKSVGFELKGSTKVKTVCGGIMSIFLYFVGIFGLIYYFTDMLLRRNAQVSVFKEKNNSVEIPLTEVIFAVSATNASGELLLLNSDFKRAVQIEAFLYREVSGEEIQTYKIPQTKCQSGLTEGHTPESDLCFDTTKAVSPSGAYLKEGELALANSTDSVGNSWLSIRLKECDERKNPECSGFLEENPFFQLKLRINDDFANSGNFSKPIERNELSISANVSKGLRTAKTIVMGKNIICTDFGLVLEENTAEVFYSVVDKSESVSLSKGNERTLVTFELETTKIVNIIDRKYTKIPEIFANLGGFLKVMSIFAGFISKPFCEYSLLRQITLNRKVKTNNFTMSGTIQHQSAVGLKGIPVRVPSLADYLKRRLCLFCKRDKSQFSKVSKELDFLNFLSRLDKVENIQKLMTETRFR